MLPASWNNHVSRRAVSTLIGASSAGIVNSALAQSTGGYGHYIPFNCSASKNGMDGLIGSTPGGPLFQYSCKPASDLSLITILLNLEYLEASFYLYAATGSGL